MSISRPLGARVIVDPIITTLSVEARAEKSGLVAVVAEKERPRPTEGRVIAVGTDPLTQETIHVGDKVSFSYLSGTRIHIDGIEYRSLEFNEIIMVTSDEEKEGEGE